jgi:hypothetical protein
LGWRKILGRGKTTKAQETKVKNMGIHQTKKFLPRKESKSIQRQPKNWEKIFAN